MGSVGIQGLAASYSYAALGLYEPTATPSLYDSFEEVFRDLKAGVIDRAFLPFENSTAGFISENFRYLDRAGMFATAEFLHRIEHCLMAPKGLRLENVKAVMSHPQALAQCMHFLNGHGLKAEPWFDTAGAARDVSRLKDRAAIASADAAVVYGLDILRKSVNDEPENFTRFLMIERTLRFGKRLIVSCDVEELRSLLRSQVKLIAMLTQPEQAVKWGHRVYVELESLDDAPWADWLKDFTNLKVLGSFDGKR